MNQQMPRFEEVKSLFDKKYVLSREQKREYYELHISDMQRFLKEMIQAQQRKCPLFSKLKPEESYIVTLPKNDITFVGGRVLLEFTITLPTLEKLEQMIKVKGVSISSRKAFSRELLCLMTDFSRNAKRKLQWYASRLENLHRHDYMTRKQLVVLRSGILEKLSEARNSKGKNISSKVLSEYEHQLLHIKIILSQKGSL